MDLTFHPFEFSEMSLAQQHLYQGLILPYAIPLFDPSLKESKLMGIEARASNELVGLAILESIPDKQVFRIQSFAIKDLYRRRGIGLHFFQLIENYLVHTLHCRAISCSYDELSPFAVAMEKILAHSGWPPAQLYFVRCHYKVQDFHPAWFETPYSLPDKLEIFPWKQITSSEKERILHQTTQGTFSPYLSPFDEESTVEPLNSLGLRYQGLLIGWNITHRVDPNTISYSSLYIEKEFHLLGYAIFLLIQSIRLQQQSSIPRALFEVNLNRVDPAWWRFVKRRLLPYADQVEKKKWVTRAFI